MKRPTAIIFDLDDTISSFDSVCQPAWIEVCDRFTATLQTRFTSKELFDSIHNVKREYWSDPARHKWGREHLIEARREVAKIALEKLGITEEAAANRLGDDYSATQDSKISLLPGSMEALERFRRMEIRMAVLTNGHSAIQREKLSRFGIMDFFEKVFIDSETGFSKPDTRAYEYALKTLDLPAKEVWMIGDNLIWDVKGAKDAGIYAVWNDYKGSGLPIDTKIIPDKIVTSIHELAMHCEGMEQ